MMGGRGRSPRSRLTIALRSSAPSWPASTITSRHLKAGYLFPEIGRRVRAFQEAHPDRDLIKLGIGDVTEPLPASVREAMHAAVDELGVRETFRGYGPEKGYAFLREAIAEHDFAGLGVSPEEIYISDGSKCDCGNMLDIFAGEGANRVAVADPVYPVYVDTNVMAGNAGPGRRGRAVFGTALSGSHRRERLSARDSRGGRGRRLPLLPQQPHRRRRLERVFDRSG